MNFAECVNYCAANQEFVEGFDRLTDSHFSTVANRTPLDALIDEATGRDRTAAFKFVAFVWETVWTRLPTEARR